jgi:hypothetical protein
MIECVDLKTLTNYASKSNGIGKITGQTGKKNRRIGNKSENVILIKIVIVNVIIKIIIEVLFLFYSLLIVLMIANIFEFIPHDVNELLTLRS